MNPVSKMIVGLLVMIGGALTYYWWYLDLWTLFKGGFGLLVMLIGFVIFLIGKEERAFEKEEEELERQLKEEEEKEKKKKKSKKD